MQVQPGPEAAVFVFLQQFFNQLYPSHDYNKSRGGSLVWLIITQDPPIDAQPQPSIEIFIPETYLGAVSYRACSTASPPVGTPPPPHSLSSPSTPLYGPPHACDFERVLRWHFLLSCNGVIPCTSEQRAKLYQG
ncbi:hypothetical protein SODALDRAFT_356032 [Sodiomyces alkalinus F11]|uniref:Uncharacterized protein n=1 Tax=Sodiomyces alkalinus (strain CBS 110278 / VKM F-3762 / F11) TaxID=1314773 RepID=A0A3N2QAP6_SODAK|nr:hypothetical protein SODALDRAFT_356032 [Sodiomyces alkalinus F11]ROT43806.1 hypothetical protein SODALDRAFT_356032 [Sodiomyces alkalinus F11]